MKNIIVSKFSSYKSTTPANTNLLDWLNDATYKEVVEKIRCLSDKDQIRYLKSKLPCITPSGIFLVRSAKALIQHSGYICIDIDGGDNPSLKDFAKVRDELRKISNISYTGLSVSGKGVFCLFPIKYPEKHKEHFEALKIQFQNIGIVIDKACGDVSRLRGYSYDPDAYFNENAIVFNQIFEYEHKKTIRAEKPQLKTYSPGNSTLSKVTNLINIINASGIDITDKYEQWVQIGCALANEFGEEGRELFHLVSENHPKYFFESCDEKFTTLMGKNYSYTIGTFFHWAEQYGFK